MCTATYGRPPLLRPSRWLSLTRQRWTRMASLSPSPCKASAVLAATLHATETTTVGTILRRDTTWLASGMRPSQSTARQCPCQASKAAPPQFRLCRVSAQCQPAHFCDLPTPTIRPALRPLLKCRRETTRVCWSRLRTWRSLPPRLRALRVPSSTTSQHLCWVSTRLST